MACVLVSEKSNKRGGLGTTEANSRAPKLSVYLPPSPCVFHCPIVSNDLKKIYLFLERGEVREKERERDIYVREKLRLVASCKHPNWGPHLRPRRVP